MQILRSQCRQYERGAGWRFQRSVEASLSAQLVLRAYGRVIFASFTDPGIRRMGDLT